jgi:hypothetical protein
VRPSSRRKSEIPVRRKTLDGEEHKGSGPPGELCRQRDKHSGLASAGFTDDQEASAANGGAQRWEAISGEWDTVANG